MKRIAYRTTGTCSQLIEVAGENGCVTDVTFYGGCNGNLQGISKLVRGMKYEEVIERLNHISCNGKPTSCPDQLCRAIEVLMQEEANE
ncbi:MAG: TIGR03905 family TSCPD domain-containing protein [Bacteroidaceae bacterium]|nr:TIGR03905 family TSCPD domain-containing protein [Bacteroidaceae bacterium]MBR5276352.1 TIGR03905 family TSCPD domain-containing protein [Bacteroidaceae bacterium]MBR5891868.1 TIGR03905 family TSCPD domain-containing protein [Bacteroidaceae bacterium]